jgi:hypothetical protein
MNRAFKKDRLREKTRVDIEQSKQTTFDNLPETPEKETPKQTVHAQKQIEIVEVNTETREDELKLKIWFRLLPSKIAFSKITAELYFDQHHFHTVPLKILPSSLTKDNLEFNRVLEMTGIAAGPHTIKVEMYETWGSDEKLTPASKEVTVEYVPVRREDRHLIKVPFVKSEARADVAIVTEAEKSIYRETEEDMKKEQMSKREDW